MYVFVVTALVILGNRQVDCMPQRLTRNKCILYQNIIIMATLWYICIAKSGYRGEIGDSPPLLSLFREGDRSPLI